MFLKMLFVLVIFQDFSWISKQKKWTLQYCNMLTTIHKSLLWCCGGQRVSRHVISKASVIERDWQTKKSLWQPRSASGVQKIKKRHSSEWIFFFYEQCIIDGGVGISPLIQDKVKMCSVQEPAGSQEITHWHRHSLTPHLPLYSIIYWIFTIKCATECAAFYHQSIYNS